jgi:serine phosphatase RsbU (regulator of sigma subunit)
LARVVIFDPGINDLEHIVNSFASEQFTVNVLRHGLENVASIAAQEPDCLIIYLDDDSSLLSEHIKALASAGELQNVPLIGIRPMHGAYDALQAVNNGVVQILSLPLERGVLEANVRGQIREQGRVQTLRRELQQNTRMFSELQEDLQLGQNVQQSLLPPARLHSEHFQLESALLPSGQLCGDYQDYRLLGPGRLAVFQADVSGHGVASALIASRLKAYFDDNCDAMTDPAQFMRNLNLVLLNFGEHYQIATAVCLLVDLDTRLVRAANAGHRTTYWFNREGSEHIEIASSGPALGMFENYEITSVELPIAWQRNRMVIFTDGLIEFKQDDHRWVSEESFRDSILRRGLEGPLAAYAESLLRKSHELSETGTWQDDVSLIVIDFA